MGIELFVVFLSFPFNVHKICGIVFSLIFDISRLYGLYFLFMSHIFFVRARFLKLCSATTLRIRFSPFQGLIVFSCCNSCLFSDFSEIIEVYTLWCVATKGSSCLVKWLTMIGQRFHMCLKQINLLVFAENFCVHSGVCHQHSPSQFINLTQS